MARTGRRGSIRVKRFRFRLEQVLRVRRLQEDEARFALLDANRRAHEKAVQLEVRIDAYRQRALPPGPQTYAEFERNLFLLDSAAGAVVIARTEHRDALDLVEERRADWAAARQKVAALERLEDRRREEHALEVRREEDRIVDDLVVTRHGRGAIA